MDLEYILGANSDGLQLLQRNGVNSEQLFRIIKPLIRLGNILKYTNPELAALAYKLKNVYDYKRGRQVEPDLILYENSRGFASKISILSRVSGQTYFFTAEHSARRTDKWDTRYCCELCANNEMIYRANLKLHVIRIHEIFS